MLLSYGADPNLRVYGEVGSTSSILRPPLAELLASNEDTSDEELSLLLKHGARVVMKTQYRDPDGLLNCLGNVSNAMLQKLIDVAEEFDPCMIRRNIHLTPVQKQLILEKASAPLSLKSICRGKFRKLFGRDMPDSAPQLFIPVTLRKYLLYDHS